MGKKYTTVQGLNEMNKEKEEYMHMEPAKAVHHHTRCTHTQSPKGSNYVSFWTISMVTGFHGHFGEAPALKTTSILLLKALLLFFVI